LTGTKLKSDVIGEYYHFWWGITSGGPSKDHAYPTAIVELNAATGEVCIEDTNEIVLGSAGHALELKVNFPYTNNLKLVLIEENAECYSHLKNVIRKRWPSVSIDKAERLDELNTSNLYLLNMSLDEALKAIENLSLGNAIYFFDPLLSVKWEAIEKVASKRMINFHQTGTEFLIFLFTSDWFLGREDFAPLPITPDGDSWTDEEAETVSEADALFGGNKKWRRHILNKKPMEEKELTFVSLYKNMLYKWFRYVLPLPFNPKSDQLFHLILCSNYEDGVRATKNHYSSLTDNPVYSPSNKDAFHRFKRLHPDLFVNLSGRRRPMEWRILWSVIMNHEDGRCDRLCRDFRDIEHDTSKTQLGLKWLMERGYLESDKTMNAWNSDVRSYRLKWKVVSKRLGIEMPPQLVPLSPEQVLKNRRVEMRNAG